MRLGILGGSFDPVHFGHLLMAECCLEQCALDELWFVPAAVPPHKQDAVPSPAQNRVEMLQLAISGHPKLQVCAREIDRGGVSYTVDTLEDIHGEKPDASLFFVMGADSLHDLPSWRQPTRICELVTVVVVHRPGVPAPDYDVLANLVSAERLSEMKRSQVEMPAIDLSSSDIRSRVTAQRTIRYRTPRAVEKYIESHGLYT